MDPLAIIISSAGALLLLFISGGIGLLIRNSQRQGDKIDGVATALASISATLSAVVTRVDALDRWKDAVQQRENDDLRAENAALKEDRGRRAGDNA